MIALKACVRMSRSRWIGRKSLDPLSSQINRFGSNKNNHSVKTHRHWSVYIWTVVIRNAQKHFTLLMTTKIFTIFNWYVTVKDLKLNIIS